MRISLIAVYLILATFVPLLAVNASDLDDGISSYTDDNISKWDELGKKDRNVTFIKMNAKSQAKVRSNGGIVTGTSGGANMNSVILGAGGTVRGDIIIIDDSSGDKTQVVE